MQISIFFAMKIKIFSFIIVWPPVISLHRENTGKFKFSEATDMFTYSVTKESLIAAIDAEEIGYIRPLVRSCLEAQGLSPWDDVEAEIFPGKRDLLLIARPRSPLSSRPDIRRRQHRQ